MGPPDSILGQIGETARFYIICQHYEQTAGPICMKLSGKVWSDHWTTWLHFWSIPRETARCRDANFFANNITSKPLDWFAWNFQGRCGV